MFGTAAASDRAYWLDQGILCFQHNKPSELQIYTSEENAYSFVSLSDNILGPVLSEMKQEKVTPTLQLGNLKFNLSRSAINMAI